MNKRKIRRFFSNINYRNLFFAILGSAIVAFGTAIHVDSGAADGGVIGLARIIEYYTNGRIAIEVSSLLINVLCYLLAWRLMDMEFILSMGVGTLTYSLFVGILDNAFTLHIPNVFLATLVGMICIEVGTGLMLRYGSSPNGEHVLSMAIAKKGEFNFGWVHFIKDFVIIIMFFPITDAQSVIYSLFLMTLTTPIMDIIVSAPKKTSIKRNISQKKNQWILIIITGLVIIGLFVLGSIYVNDYYRADEMSIETLTYENIEVQTFEGGYTVYLPRGEIKAGLVFYPGGKVEYTAYAPLLKECASKGILCIDVQMPFNLAVLGVNKGLEATKLYPDIDTWYIGGHSLGGSMAASCASSHPDVFEGVILLGSYSTADLTDLRVVSIFGSDDKVMNAEKYDKYKKNLPLNFTEQVIEGGNHAYFGMYGEQKGDGAATITNLEQITITANYIIEFITK